MKYTISTILILLFFTGLNAQVNTTWKPKGVPKTSTSTYNATNLKTTKYTKYNTKVKNNAKLVTTSYATIYQKLQRSS